MKQDDRIRLTHMVDALGHAIRFTEGRTAPILITIRC
jgi:hypothetical protein